MLNVCLASLENQTRKDFNVVVADNGMHHVRHSYIASRYAFQHHEGKGRDCYESANFEALKESASGEYLCFPSDDGYYAPRFFELMLKHGDGAEIIYCNCVWDGRGYGPGEELIHLDTSLNVGKLDKGGFLIKKALFLAAGGFQGPFGVDRCEDGFFIRRVLASGVNIRAKKVGIVGWMHN